MPAYAYTGLNAAGKTVKGIENCDSIGALKASLKMGGVYLTSVDETAGGASSSRRTTESGGGGLATDIDLSGFFDRVSPKMVVSMTRLLATMLKAGVTLPESLSALIEQQNSQKFKGILGDLTSQVNEGASFADALSDHKDVFSDLYINMVRAGEASGSLELVLVRIAEFLENQEELKSKVTTAMFYPLIMSVVAAAVIGILMVGVVPKIAGMFEDQGAELPWTTRFLMTVSYFLADFWWLVIALLIAAVIGFKRWRGTEAGRLTTDAIILRIPIIGTLARQLAISRFSRTLSTMLASGVQLLEAMDIVRRLLGNVVLEKIISKARDEIREGEGIAKALSKTREFPPLVIQMISVGERSGSLESMLNDLANIYDGETSTSVERMTAALEPIMIVVMAGAVGFIVFAIMTPIMQMNQMVG